MEKRIKIIGIAGLALILLLAGGMAYLLWERSLQSGVNAHRDSATAEALLERDIALALLASAKGDFRQALEIVDRLLANNPGNPRLHALRNRIMT